MADICEKRLVSGDIVSIINKLKYKDEPIAIQGSAKLAVQKYYSDIDLFSQISEPTSAQKIYDQIRLILKRGSEASAGGCGQLYFIELKVQNTDETKTKFNSKKDFTQTAFLRAIDGKNLDFIKIDYVLYLANTMTELSVIYSFTEPKSVDSPLKALSDEVEEYKAIIFHIQYTRQNRADGSPHTLIQLPNRYDIPDERPTQGSKTATGASQRRSNKGEGQLRPQRVRRRQGRQHR